MQLFFIILQFQLKHMKKISLAAIAAVYFFMTSCSNQATEQTTNKDSVVTSHQETTPASPSTTVTTPPATPPEENAPASSSKPQQIESKPVDSPKTSISIGKNGASVKTKKGTGVSVDQGGLKVQHKDVNIDFKKDSL